ncbi:hypothetical protein Mlg_2376 [Alkalilimnicola ehrlichii MLHE-1]|uniref:Uncharacterized protein n=2 Tax=Alkalilimnicola ehrlichii TaxID=351052 RepID=Q0A621_ALKEH|nr:hypothetical protein Mlg_2376 [Alkalilimnicola ehrlichii MLHE-1]
MESKAGAYTHYYGDRDEAGNVVAIRRVVVNDPVDPMNNTVLVVDDDHLDLQLENAGIRLQLEQLEDDVAFTFSDLGKGESYSSTLAKAEQEAEEADDGNGNAVHAATLMHAPRGGEGITVKTLNADSGSVMGQASLFASSFSSQQILVQARGACGLVFSGKATAVVAADAAMQIDGRVSFGPGVPPIALDWLRPPSVHIDLKPDVDKDGFYGEVGLDDLPTVGEVLASGGLNFALNEVASAVTEKTLVAAVTRLLLAFPKIGLPVLLLANVPRVKRVWQVITEVKGMIDGTVKLYKAGNDLVHMRKGPDDNFPVMVEARYSGAGTTETGAVSIAEPGSQPAVVELELEDGKDAHLHELILSPSAPGRGQSYRIELGVDCDEAPEMSIHFSVEGTDGYSASRTFSIQPDQRYAMTVPGAESGVRDTVVAELRRGDEVLDRKQRQLVFQG